MQIATANQDVLLSRYVNGNKSWGPPNEPFRRIYLTNDPQTRLLYRPFAPRVDGDGLAAGLHLRRYDHSTAGAWAAAEGAVAVNAGPGPGVTLLPVAIVTGAEAAARFLQSETSSARRAVPSWMPVPYREVQPRDDMPATGNAAPIEPLEMVREVQGWLKQSFRSPEDIPMLPWHHGYDWNFHFTIPGASPYAYLMSRRYSGDPDDFECEWDIGALSIRQHLLNHHPRRGHSGAATVDVDLQWPMTGWYTWLAGRWIYDGGHPWPDARFPRQPNESDADWWDRAPMAWHTELHPCMAMATWRTEAVEFSRAGVTLFEFPSSDRAAQSVSWSAGAPGFPRPGLRLPAAQFEFFAAKHGGYHDFYAAGDPRDGLTAEERAALPERRRAEFPDEHGEREPAWAAHDYSFLVDLPRLPDRPSPHAVPDPLHPTGTLPIVGHRWPPPLLIAIDPVDPGQLRSQLKEPTISVLVNPEPRPPARGHGAQASTGSLPPRPTAQAVVRINREAFVGRTEYGVRVSFAWSDEPHRPEDQTVRVRVRFDRVVFWETVFHHEIWQNMACREAVLRFGINGRWYERRLEDLQPGVSASVPSVEAVVYLPRSESIVVSVNGFGIPAPETMLGGRGDYIAEALATLNLFSPTSVHAMMDWDAENRRLRLADPPNPQGAAIAWRQIATAPDNGHPNNERPLSVDVIANAMVDQSKSTLDLENRPLAHFAARHLVSGLLNAPDQQSGRTVFMPAIVDETTAIQGPLPADSIAGNRDWPELRAPSGGSRHGLAYSVGYIIEAEIVRPPEGT